jgi:inhibitor of cysteine peptidase
MKKSLLFALILGAWACTGRAEVEKAGNTESVVVRFTQDGGSQSAALSKGRTLVVIIAGNPTTGYEWELTDTVNSAVLEQEGRVEFVDGAQDLMGAPGEYRFVFKAMAPGMTAIGLKYVRPWEQDKPPAATATVNVTVTE